MASALFGKGTTIADGTSLPIAKGRSHDDDLDRQDVSNMAKLDRTDRRTIAPCRHIKQVSYVF